MVRSKLFRTLGSFNKKRYKDMARKIEYTYFTKTIDGVERTIACWTSNTRDGFAHHARMSYGEKTISSKVEYLNRTWETFRYETVIDRLINRLPKDEQDKWRKVFIKGESEAEAERCDKWFNDFKDTFDGLSEESKQIVREKTPFIETKEQGDAVLAGMKMLSLFDLLRK